MLDSKTLACSNWWSTRQYSCRAICSTTKSRCILYSCSHDSLPSTASNGNCSPGLVILGLYLPSHGSERNRGWYSVHDLKFDRHCFFSAGQARYRRWDLQYHRSDRSKLWSQHFNDHREFGHWQVSLYWSGQSRSSPKWLSCCLLVLLCGKFGHSVCCPMGSQADWESWYKGWLSQQLCITQCAQSLCLLRQGCHLR